MSEGDQSQLSQEDPATAVGMLAFLGTSSARNHTFAVAFTASQADDGSWDGMSMDIVGMEDDEPPTKLSDVFGAPMVRAAGATSFTAAISQAVSSFFSELEGEGISTTLIPEMALTRQEKEDPE